MAPAKHALLVRVDAIPQLLEVRERAQCCVELLEPTLVRAPDVVAVELRNEHGRKVEPDLAEVRADGAVLFEPELDVVTPDVLLRQTDAFHHPFIRAPDVPPEVHDTGRV